MIRWIVGTSLKLRYLVLVIAAALIVSGHAEATPVAIVEGASLPGSRVYYTTIGGLEQAAERASTAPTLLLVGPQFRARAGMQREEDEGVPDLLARTGS